MIQWWYVMANSIWILALALALAVFSIAYYQAQLGKVKIASNLGTPKFVIPLYVAGGLFSLGMALTTDTWWEIALWFVLMGLFFYEMYRTYLLNREG